VKVVGIDPGTTACGYGIVHASGGRLRAIDHGWWSTPAGERPELRLKTIYDGVDVPLQVNPRSSCAGCGAGSPGESA